MTMLKCMKIYYQLKGSRCGFFIKYANTVYGKNMFKYELFNKDSLVEAIMIVVNFKQSNSEKILSIQNDLRDSVIKKFSSILDIFDEVINVQK